MEQGKPIVEVEALELDLHEIEIVSGGSGYISASGRTDPPRDET